MTGKDIAAKRKELNIAQNALAEQCNMTRAALSAIENESFQLIPDELVRIWNTLIAMKPEAEVTENAA